MHTDSALTKQSSDSEIRLYFEKVLELKRSNYEYPVNLDDVWPLVYSRRDKASSSLRENFIENEDYITVTQKGEGAASPNGGAGMNKICYKLSISCLEYFIARKIRPVFDVYRKVFHKVTGQKQLTPAELFLQNAQLMVEHERRMTKVENDVLELKARTATRPDYMTIVGYGTLHHIHVGLPLACSLGRKATKICNERGISMDTIPDPRFGTVKMYPIDVLCEVFNATVN